MRRVVATVIVFGAVASLFAACVEPPPKVASLPAGGLSLRVFVFGATAQEGRQAFEAARQTNRGLRVVHEGGDGEVLVGLENDSPKCVAPTALCSYKVSIRIRDNQNKVVHAESTSVTANGNHCSDLCDRALNAMVVKVLEAAAANLHPVGDAGVEPEASAPPEPTDAGAPPAEAGAKDKEKTGAKKPGKPPPPKAEPGICAIARGPHLPAEEAEKRAAQVEALKRLEVLDQDEYDCLRKAYLDRL